MTSGGIKNLTARLTGESVNRVGTCRKCGFGIVSCTSISYHLLLSSARKSWFDAFIFANIDGIPYFHCTHFSWTEQPCGFIFVRFVRASHITGSRAFGIPMSQHNQSSNAARSPWQRKAPRQSGNGGRLKHVERREWRFHPQTGFRCLFWWRAEQR